MPQPLRRKPAGKPSFSALAVADVMHRDIVTNQQTDPITAAIRSFIRHKSDATLVIGKDKTPLGVVTKTEVMAAYFAMLELSTPVADIMASPVIHCAPEDSLEAALGMMQHHGIQRVYVLDRDDNSAIGALSYTDVVGALYRYCCQCDFSRRNRGAAREHGPSRLTVGEVMTRSVPIGKDTETIFTVIDHLADCRKSALPLLGTHGQPTGVISKTDLTLAYRRGIALTEPASLIMSRPIATCSADALLEDAIRQMIFAEVGRLFVTDPGGRRLTGMLSLADAARARSGSCLACSVSRIIA